MNQAPILYRLQSLDLEIEAIVQRLAEIDNILRNDENLARAQTNLNNVQEKQKEAVRNLRHAENAVQDIQIKIENNEKALYGGKIINPKELADLQKENVSLKKRLAELEDEQLDQMLATEQADLEIEMAEGDLNNAKAQAIQQHSQLMGENSQISAEKATRQTERDALAGSILPDNLKIYLRLRKTKQGRAISVIDDNSCSICGTSIRPAEMQEARAPNQMALCSSCGRILYAK